MEECELTERVLASDEQVELVMRLCKHGKTSLGSAAQSNDEDYWRIGKAGLEKEVERHIECGRKIFRKRDRNDPRNFFKNKIHANVTILGERDVYVEITFVKENRGLILNAHEHTTSYRLPQ